MPNYGGGSQRRQVMAAEVRRIRMRMHEMQLRGAFGTLPVEEDLSPAEVLYEELRRTVGVVRWIELKMTTEWDDALVSLGVSNIDDKGSMQTAPTHEGLWFAVYHQEREHLGRIAKMCIDAGVELRKVELAERQADMIAGIIDAAFAALDLTPEQEAKIPTIMPSIIQQMALPHTTEST